MQMRVEVAAGFEAMDDRDHIPGTVVRCSTPQYRSLFAMMRFTTASITGSLSWRMTIEDNRSAYSAFSNG